MLLLGVGWPDGYMQSGHGLVQVESEMVDLYIDDVSLEFVITGGCALQGWLNVWVFGIRHGVVPVLSLRILVRALLNIVELHPEPIAIL